MNIFQASKRTFLFVTVNILVLLTISLVLAVLGVPRYFQPTQYKMLLVFCFAWGMGGAFISLAMSRWIAKWSMGVRVIDPNTDHPELRNLVQTVHYLSRQAGLKVMPEVGIYDSPDVNAFATGPTKARSLVAVSTGLLNNMGRREVAGVLAHEVAHIANGDMVTMTLIQGVINAFVMFLARILAFVVTQAMRGDRDNRGGGGGLIQFLLVWVFEIVFSLFGAIVVNWFSRWREFRADAGGAALAGSDSMISALRSLQRTYQPQLAAQESAAFQSMKISGKSGGFRLLFASHPPLEERIARLEEAAARR